MENVPEDIDVMCDLGYQLSGVDYFPDFFRISQDSETSRHVYLRKWFRFSENGLGKIAEKL